MRKTPNISDIISNKVNQGKTLEQQAADLGALVNERDSVGSIFGNNPEKMAELKMLIEIQKKVVIRMINGDEEEYIPPPPKRPHLRIVK